MLARLSGVTVAGGFADAFVLVPVSVETPAPVKPGESDAAGWSEIVSGAEPAASEGNTL